jgi:hypothetical protein
VLMVRVRVKIRVTCPVHVAVSNTTPNVTLHEETAS